jgi:hypothetical protein
MGDEADRLEQPVVDHLRDAFKTEYGLIQQSLFYAPTYTPDDVDCLQTNLQRAHELAPYYKYDKATTE